MVIKEVQADNELLSTRQYREGKFTIVVGIFVSLDRFTWEQGWCSGESARLPPMCPGFDSRTRLHMWAEFVGSLLCSERFFSGNSGFPLSSKTNI